MASLSRTKSGWMIQFNDGRIRTIRLGHLPDKVAQQTKTKIEVLIQCNAVGALDASTRAWLEELSEKLRGKLAAVGLVKSRDSDTLEPFLLKAIASKSSKSQQTTANLHQTKGKLLEHFGDVDLRSITPRQADEWLAKLKGQGYAVSTWSGFVKKAKHFFRIAVRWELLETNPFAGLKAPKQVNSRRQSYVPEDVIRLLISRTTAPLGRVLALARWGGVRVPTEIARMFWENIDWDKGTVFIDSVKTGPRTFPLFPELRDYLEPARKASGPVVEGIRTDKNLRSRVTRLLERCGIERWERLFQNLRSSRQSDLCRKYSIATVCKWLGNSPAVASDHYLQALDEEFQNALRPALREVPRTSENDSNPGCDVLPFSPKHSEKLASAIPLRGRPKSLQISQFCKELGFCAVVRAVGLSPVLRSWDSLTIRERHAIRSVVRRAG